jgi:hypothetical protein
MHHRSWEAHMKRVFVAAAIVMFGIGSAFAQETCESKAVSAEGKREAKAVDSNGKPLNGAAKNRFTKKCGKHSSLGRCGDAMGGNEASSARTKRGQRDHSIQEI